jgi:hypothetical protein
MTAHPGSQALRAAASVRTGPVLGRPSAAPGAFLARLRAVRTIASTVPSNGDVNPYGIVVIRHSAGRLHAGDILVSNFNDKANLQGTGSTIAEITPAGKPRVFAQITKAMLRGSCPGGLGCPLPWPSFREAGWPLAVPRHPTGRPPRPGPGA